MHTLYIAKRFTSGTLKGQVVFDQVCGSDVTRLYRQWQVGTTRKAWRYGPSYVVVDASFQKFAR